MENDNDLDAIWSKASTVQGNDPSRWRKDECGAWIGKKEYGDRDSEYGWEIHHIDGNPDNNIPSNLLPLQWKNNLARDKPNSKKCEVTG